MPIIIIQADHSTASGFTNYIMNDEYVTTKMLQERMRIFNTYYLPSFEYIQLYDSITPVNTFRIIFNHYFDTNYELLNNKSYFSTSQAPFRFVDVTEKVKYY